MKKTISLATKGLIIFLLVVLFGCKSTPPAEPETQVETAPEMNVQTVTDESVDPALVSLREQVEQLRNECLAYKLENYAPEDWTQAETARDAGNAAYTSDQASSTQAYTEAIAHYERVKKNGFNALAAELSQALDKERQATVDSGANSYYPEQFSMADSSRDAAISLFEKEDYPAAYDEAQRALMRYQTLRKGKQAVELKATIDTNQFAQYDSESYALGIQKYEAAVVAYGNADAEALDHASQSVALAQKVTNTGFRMWSEELIEKNGEIQALCDSIKAKRSMAREYEEAEAIFTKAQEFGRADEWENAYNAYSSSVVAYTDVYQGALLKKNAADLAISAAAARQAKSTELALRADEIAPLPEGTPGFENEEAPAQDVTEEPVEEVEEEPVIEMIEETEIPDESFDEESFEEEDEVEVEAEENGEEVL